VRGGDVLAIPRLKQYVTVIGEIQSPTTHVYKSDLSRDEYVALSGGTTQRADDDRIYVVRANGSVVAAQESSFWFKRSASTKLEPGDTVVVPLDAERMRPLPLWTAVTTIVYNLAVAVAAIGSL
jgi:polysaccharide export outer membrane protein